MTIETRSVQVLKPPLRSLTEEGYGGSVHQLLHERRIYRIHRATVVDAAQALQR